MNTIWLIGILSAESIVIFFLAMYVNKLDTTVSSLEYKCARLMSDYKYHEKRIIRLQENLNKTDIDLDSLGKILGYHLQYTPEAYKWEKE